MKQISSIGDRMKDYENISRIYLTKRSAVIIRIDGKAFHSFTKGFCRPFDNLLMNTMRKTAQYLCENISGCKLAYIQSDEISLLLTDYDTKDTQPWFDNNLQKLVSVSASMATMAFNKFICKDYLEEFQERWSKEKKYSDQESSKLIAYDQAVQAAIEKGAMFDSRAFVIPKEEVCNYFIWRQQDATRNSILMVSQYYFSHSEMQGKTCDILQDMLFKKFQVNWNDYPTDQKRGSCVIRVPAEINGVQRNKWTVDVNIPIFTQDRKYIDKLVFKELN